MIRAPARSGDSLVLVLGRRATVEGSRGFQPTVGHPAKPFRRGATIEPSPRDRRPISFAPLTPAFHRRSATNHSRVIVLRGLKPTATVKCRSATGGGSAILRRSESLDGDRLGAVARPDAFEHFRG